MQLFRKNYLRIKLAFVYSVALWSALHSTTCKKELPPQCNRKRLQNCVFWNSYTMPPRGRATSALHLRSRTESRVWSALFNATFQKDSLPIKTYVHLQKLRVCSALHNATCKIMPFPYYDCMRLQACGFGVQCAMPLFMRSHLRTTRVFV